MPNRRLPHELLVDEVGTRGVLDRRPQTQETGTLGWRTQLPGTELHARWHAPGRQGVLLPLQLRRAGHRRHCRSGHRRLSRSHPVRSEKQVLRRGQLARQPALAGMLLLRKGNRLSVMPVEAAHWKYILALE